MAPFFYEEELFMLISALVSSVPSMIFGIAAYILSAMAFYTLAQRRGIQNPWLAWIPVANCWILGSISDQYQYLVKGKNKSKRKVLLILKLLALVLSLTLLVLVAVMAAGAMMVSNEKEILSTIMGPAIGAVGLCVPVIGVAIAELILRYMALYDVFRSMDPTNSVLFLVLSILFQVTEPFFLFFNRQKDGGMPPRKQPEPVCIPYEEPVPEAEEENPKDYL